MNAFSLFFGFEKKIFIMPSFVQDIFTNYRIFQLFEDVMPLCSGLYISWQKVCCHSCLCSFVHLPFRSHGWFIFYVWFSESCIMCGFLFLSFALDSLKILDIWVNRFYQIWKHFSHYLNISSFSLPYNTWDTSHTYAGQFGIISQVTDSFVGESFSLFQSFSFCASIWRVHSPMVWIHWSFLLPCVILLITYNIYFFQFQMLIFLSYKLPFGSLLCFIYFLSF